MTTLIGALWQAVQSLHRAGKYFGELYRRWRARLGGPKAITATAHQLARILGHLLKYKRPFSPEVFVQEEAKMNRRKLARLQNLAAPSTANSCPNHECQQLARLVSQEAAWECCT